MALGEKLKVVSEVNPGRAFPVKVVELEASRCMAWKGGMPLGLFKGMRTYELEPEARRARASACRSASAGPLLPLIGRSIPDLGPSFDQFARGLKQRVEGGG